MWDLWTEVDVFSKRKEQMEKKERGGARIGISGCVDKHSSEARRKGRPSQGIQDSIRDSRNTALVTPKYQYLGSI